jgi:hypothetical protein
MIAVAVLAIAGAAVSSSSKKAQLLLVLNGDTHCALGWMLVFLCSQQRHILSVLGCTRQPGAMMPTAWARSDGQPVSPALLDIDRLDCRDGIQKPDGAAGGKANKDGDSRAMVDDFVSCMRGRGYVQLKS